jgi:NAD(P)-dependent dehydrogenase (short-subunit alcohol dehydrogenase family)
MQPPGDGGLAVGDAVKPSATPTRHQGRVAVVTGAATGIGRGIALRLAADGASVCCLDINGDEVQRTAGRISDGGGKALSRVVDVRDKAAVKAAMQETVRELGGLDMLVNCAGTVTMTGFDELSEEEWDRVLDVNLKGYFLVTQAAAEYLAASDRAGVVNISTIESEIVISTTGQCQVHYNASKGGVRMLTKALATSLAARGVRVNAVAPGAIDTLFTGVSFGDPEVFATFRDRLLIDRVGQPEDIAAAASFLLSDEASYITGVQLPVDGGWLVR